MYPVFLLITYLEEYVVNSNKVSNVFCVVLLASCIPIQGLEYFSS